MIESLLELVEIERVENTSEYKNMVDISVESDESFILSNGIISHNSAAGGVKQSRDSEKEGVYALKGKIKNTRTLSDLTTNKEILEIMSVLGIEPGSEKPPTYKNIIIAADEDCIDAEHVIVTSNGNKKIKDISYDDMILTHDGSFQKIEKIIETVKDSFLEIEINGKIFVCSENHILIVFRDSQIKEIEACELRKTDFLLLKNDI
jgi:hypothetical protein